MRYTPDLQMDADEIAALKAEPWMLDLLTLNPAYNSWGPREDAMCVEGKGWTSRRLIDRWHADALALDDLNEVVNFYFEVVRESRTCDDCGQSGYNPATRTLSESFHREWGHDLTQDEVDALVAHNRLRDLTSEFVAGQGWRKRDPVVKLAADEVNAWSRRTMLGHDAINRCIAVEARAKRIGVYGLCEACGGSGEVYTEDAAHVQLVLWGLHPRKGASRGIEIAHIERDDLPGVFAFLAKAAERNAERFSRVVAKHMEAAA